MPQSPTASKREVARAFAAASYQARSVDSLLPILQNVAQDSEVSKAILSRNFLGRRRWFFLGT